MKKSGLGARLIVAGWGIPLLLGSTYLGGVWFFALISIISLLALKEYYQLQTSLNRKPMPILGMLLGLVILSLWQWGTINSLTWGITAAVLIVFCLSIILGRSHLDALTCLGGIIYIPLLAGTFMLIRNIPAEAEGRWIAFCVWGAIWICDTAAYAGGSAFGKHKLAPAVSPNKTVEGFISGLIGALVFGLIWAAAGLVNYPVGIIVGLSAGTLGQIGDLFESKIKRETGVKDSGTFLPGHGGILDRFDSLIFTAPAIAGYLLFIN